MDCATEKWVDAAGYEGLYQVSTFGLVRGIERQINGPNGVRTWPGKIIATQLVGEPRTRLVVHLHKNNKRKAKAVGRLVLESFIGLCPPNMECCHFPDRNTSNCRLDNVRWDTRTANTNDKRVHRTMPLGENHHGSKLTNELVQQIKQRQLNGEKLRKINEALPMIGRSTIQDVLKNRTWQHIDAK